MNAFTTDAGKIAVPTASSGAIFQQNVTNLNVVSNAGGIVKGSGLTGGNLEFWPGSYTQANQVPVPNASASTYDFGDTRTAGTGFGSMQLHNHDTAAKQTLFALNDWGVNGSTLDLGIGNNPTGSPDWTNAANVASYDIKRVLHVLVLPGNSDSIGPVLTSAKGSPTRNRLIVTFSEPVADTAATLANFTISGGVTVTGATLLAGQKELALTTSAQTPGTIYTVSATGIRDRSPGGNLILPGASTTFTAVVAPTVLANIAEAAGYSLIHKLAIPDAATFNTTGVPYAIDDSKFPQLQPFDRIAYCLELALASSGATSWVCVSADAFTNKLSQIGVPAAATGAGFQQNLANLNVFSSAGTGVATARPSPARRTHGWKFRASARRNSAATMSSSPPPAEPRPRAKLRPSVSSIAPRLSAATRSLRKRESSPRSPAEPCWHGPRTPMATRSTSPPRPPRASRAAPSRSGQTASATPPRPPSPEPINSPPPSATAAAAASSPR